MRKIDYRLVTNSVERDRVRAFVWSRGADIAMGEHLCIDPVPIHATIDAAAEKGKIAWIAGYEEGGEGNLIAAIVCGIHTWPGVHMHILAWPILDAADDTERNLYSALRAYYRDISWPGCENNRALQFGRDPLEWGAELESLYGDRMQVVMQDDVKPLPNVPDEVDLVQVHVTGDHPTTLPEVERRLAALDSSE